MHSRCADSPSLHCADNHVGRAAAPQLEAIAIRLKLQAPAPNKLLRSTRFRRYLWLNVGAAVVAAGRNERPMQRPDERELREQLVHLRAEHRELDLEIVAEEASAQSDQLLIKRLKKKKLALKDKITAIEDQLFPDIIA
jgi:hypothetical protein